MTLKSAVVVLVKFILVRMVIYYNICNKIERLKINFSLSGHTWQHVDIERKSIWWDLRFGFAMVNKNRYESHKTHTLPPSHWAVSHTPAVCSWGQWFLGSSLPFLLAALLALLVSLYAAAIVLQKPCSDTNKWYSNKHGLLSRQRTSHRISSLVEVKLSLFNWWLTYLTYGTTNIIHNHTI